MVARILDLFQAIGDQVTNQLSLLNACMLNLVLEWRGQTVTHQGSVLKDMKRFFVQVARKGLKEI